jgi:hypothetical protein
MATIHGTIETLLNEHDVARIARTIRKKTRNRRQLPPQEARDWMTANETALALGCSVATVHRLRRGLIPGIELLPCSQYGRKMIFRKASMARWQDNNEQRALA